MASVMSGINQPPLERAYDELPQVSGQADVIHRPYPATAGGVEVKISVLEEQVFGPLVLFGLVGATADVLADRAARDR